MLEGISVLAFPEHSYRCGFQPILQRAESTGWLPRQIVGGKRWIWILIEQISVPPQLIQDGRENASPGVETSGPAPPGKDGVSPSGLVFKLSVGCLVAPTVHVSLEKVNVKSEKRQIVVVKNIKSMKAASPLSPSEDVCLLLFIAPTNQSPIPALGASNWGGVQRLCTCALSSFLM